MQCSHLDKSAPVRRMILTTERMTPTLWTCPIASRTNSSSNRRRRERRERSGRNEADLLKWLNAKTDGELRLKERELKIQERELRLRELEAGISRPKSDL